jgi:hypothetical protein
MDVSCAFSGDGSSRSNLAKIIGDLPAPLMLIDKNPGQLRVRAPSLAQLRENILLLKHTLVVVLPEVSKELRRFHERYGVDVSGAGLEAMREIGINVEDPKQHAMLGHQAFGCGWLCLAFSFLVFRLSRVRSHSESCSPNGEDSCGEPCRKRKRTATTELSNIRTHVRPLFLG